MDAIYYFVLSSIIATFGTGAAVRYTFTKMVNDPENYLRAQTMMFVYTALVESIPIILIVYGFVYLPVSTANKVIPLIIIILSTFLNLLIAFTSKKSIDEDFSISNDIKNSMKKIGPISYALIIEIPIISLFVLIFLK